MNINPAIPVVAAVVAVYVVQSLRSNRSGSEKAIADSLANIQTAAWSFVAFQYCHVISNRTYMVFVTRKMLCGGVVRGVLPAPIKATERWRDPLFYPSPEIVAKYADIELESPQFRTMNRANFQIHSDEIDSIVFSADPKWGMATVPYSGRLFVKKKNGATIELILLGTQDGPSIRDRLVADGFGKAGF